VRGLEPRGERDGKWAVKKGDIRAEGQERDGISIGFYGKTKGRQRSRLAGANAAALGPSGEGRKGKSQRLGRDIIDWCASAGGGVVLRHARLQVWLLLGVIWESKTGTAGHMQLGWHKPRPLQSADGG
jgi:hypothetical protein